MKNKKFAFTQAEILSVLTILGIVALITIPSVINSTQKRMQEATQKRAEYLVSQVALQLQAECPRFRCTDGRSAGEHLADLLPNSNSKMSFSNIETLEGTPTETTNITVTIKGKEELTPKYTLNPTGSYTCDGTAGCPTDTTAPGS